MNYSLFFEIGNVDVCRNYVKTSDNVFISFDNTNPLYQQFKEDLANGVALSDAEGNPMTADQIKTFLEGLA